MDTAPTRGPRFGILSFAVGPYQALEAEWRWAEEIGFHSAWIPDTFAVGSLADMEQWTLLGALARATSRIRIGTLVTSIVARHPTLVAAAALTTDRISQGRVEVGLGTGDKQDFPAFGLAEWPSRERMERLEEQVAMLDRLMRGDELQRETRWYGAMHARVSAPVQRPRPPLLVAAEGPRGLNLVARQADGWCTLGGRWPMVSGGPVISETQALAATRRRVEQLEALCRDAGRDPALVRRIVLAFRRPVDPLSSIDAFDEFVGSYSGAGIGEFVVYWPPLADLRERRPASAERRAIVERIAMARFDRASRSAAGS